MAQADASTYMITINSKSSANHADSRFSRYLIALTNNKYIYNSTYNNMNIDDQSYNSICLTISYYRDYYCKYHIGPVCYNFCLFLSI